MHATAPGLTADQVLRTFQSEAFTLFLGAAIAATGLVAAAFAAIRRQRPSLLIYFALFAILYGGRMWLQTRLFRLHFRWIFIVQPSAVGNKLCCTCSGISLF